MPVRALMVGLGGFAGSILRYWLSGIAQERFPRTTFPIGTLVVNIAGCLVIGIVAELVETRGYLSPEQRALLVVGVLGGFTTFSAFANETVNALRDGALTVAFANILLSVTACLLAVWAGRQFAFYVWR